MEFTTSDGTYTSMTATTSSQTPQLAYAGWCSELGVSPSGTNLLQSLNGDDDAYLVRHYSMGSIRKFGPKNFGFCAEGMLEFFGVEPNSTITRVNATFPDISRMYTTTADVPRMAISFHPGYDAGSEGVIGWATEKLVLLSGRITRAGGQVVHFALRVDCGFGFQLVCVSGPGTRTVPIYVMQINADNTTVTQQQLLASMSAGSSSSTVITGEFSLGVFSGTVLDEAGTPASRVVRLYERASGRLVDQCVSSDIGDFSLRVFSRADMYAVALDNDEAPTLNALILDRLTLP